MRILNRVYIYKPSTTEPARNVSVVAVAAPARLYLGIRNRFKATFRGRRVRAIDIAKRGEPLPMTTVANKLSNTEKEIPKIRILSGMIAPAKFAEYKISITSFALELIIKVSGTRPSSTYLNV